MGDRVQDIAAVIGCTDVDTRGLGENLGCVVAAYFDMHPDKPEGEQPDDERGGWTPWVLDQADAALRRMAEAVIDRLEPATERGEGENA